MSENQSNNSGFTVAGTSIDDVKRKNAQSGMSYNEVKEWLAKTTGGHGTSIYSNTNVEELKRNISESMRSNK
ncbi:gamma-type small acid-soluble spore protein [Heyndrickxia sporothermodurans]|uniref:Gamma-type small acid-soluble spore protein n=1 Tax=Heyndrickxia sporothermodurans TaxID=46224 RepID=A0AB37HBW4_9BACI|nr:gamma-type small acid-soluble spore protein [Heyndrickxia sporothermodurans]MBL5772683.1 gamma-type small acid-soluble spore protein [Heyndrickxia sporothermodurans]MBL5779716.1 gamma-type small acid-soluble spore protein [Heyndrickxia sporothermodurans]MBL5783308.1 gamma-type small acid-soluble spore protein [Heyndrickxia sporothermodurans]MBL5790398.1 gamma-type small acid-soluble spore protein [Heyndrickxia sporothermodurans]MBL5797601.1 gamma-type small acid-soluble spore protein [Heynd